MVELYPTALPSPHTFTVTAGYFAVVLYCGADGATLAHVPENCWVWHLGSILGRTGSGTRTQPGTSITGLKLLFLIQNKNSLLF